MFIVENLDRHQHPIPALAVQAVIIIIDGDKSYAEQWKHLFQIDYIPTFDKLSAQYLFLPLEVPVAA